MAMSPFLANIREKVGTDLLMLPSVAGFVFDSAGRLLVARHGDVELWAAPGGGVDPDERPEDAVVRELREELSVDVAVRGLIGVYGGPEFRTVYPNGHQCGYVIAAYGCVVAGGTPTPDGEEITSWRWVTEDEISGLNMTAWSPLVVPEAFTWWRGQRL
ncbi:NUDIX domain-containing protein [Nonomuraea sediminis]|uniref:NUDIX domain-containing protein n=1 Tax=Nonomuraea sediminis TaxID=2835864 RepID=UPI001BDCCDD2|nr:NUDIX domain-containing protein [Nonomuraea sediminis]